MGKPYYVNVSAINDFMRCQFRWYCKWVLNRVPVHEAQPLAFGKLLHLIFEDKHKGIQMADAIRDRRVEWMEKMAITTDLVDISIGTKVVKQLDDLTEALLLWHDVYTFDIDCLEVEEPFELDLGDGLIYRGRPDRVAVRQGSLWHVQHKGLAAGTNFAVFTDLSKRSYHEHLYMEALSRKYDKYKIGGTMFDLIRKLKYRTNVGKKNETVKGYQEMFQQIPVAVDLNSPTHKHVMESMRYHAQMMQRIASDPSWVIPAPNETMNAGMFGNSIDDYFRVLTGEITLDDNRYFKNREDMYEPMIDEND